MISESKAGVQSTPAAGDQHMYVDPFVSTKLSPSPFSASQSSIIGEPEGSFMEAADLRLHGNGKKPPRRCSTTAVTLLMFLVTNTVSIVVSSGAGPSLLRRYKPATIRLWDGSAALLADLNATQAALDASRAELAGLHARVGTANELLRTLLDAMAAARDGATEQQTAGGGGDGWTRELAGELKLAVGPLQLLTSGGHGRNGTGDEAAVFPALGHACVRVQDDLERYMAYTPGGECPADEALAHRLMLSGCEPLPRRRCRPPSPKGYAHPLPLPTSLWATPPDTSVVWDAYPCKNYSCLQQASSSRGCDGCFDLRRGREKAQWARDDGALSYSIAAVLAARPNGTVRVGLDLGGAGSSSPGTFAARMLERGVTVVNAAVSAGAPVNSFIASRGLVSVHVSAAHRLPFFDRALDIVHAAGGLGGGGPTTAPGVMMEFALFDVYRVLRPGGLFWLDHFPCPRAQVNATFAPMLGHVGFKKLRWNTGRGKEKNQWYISALLEKPMA